MQEKTIAAISTAQAPGGIGIVRLSGKDSREIADRIFHSKSGKRAAQMKGYTASFGAVYSQDGEKLDDAVLLLFAAPKSYTGEDVVEISCHGGLYITQRVLREALLAGAKPAGPGEFTRRAFLNGKIDLTQAEAVMQIISAGGEEAARAAQAVGSGALSKRIEKIKEGLFTLASHLSAWADFPEEEVPEVEEEELREGLHTAKTDLSKLLQSFDTGRIFREGLVTVIAGKPNGGKSTLMNLLTGFERSIVTEFAGTTRDVVEETVLLGGIPLRLADTAGIRKTEDPVETIGVDSAKKRIETAQLVLAVFDGSKALSEEDLELMESLRRTPAIAVVNKADLPLQADLPLLKEKFPYLVSLSALTGEGIEELEKQLKHLLQTENFQPSQGILCTERQRKDAQKALEALEEGEKALSLGLTFDAVTVCVEDALSALSALTGEHVSEEIVDRVFEEFCVGK